VFCVCERMKRRKKGKKILEVKCDVDVDVAFGVEG
jgi:hypothetical protein